MRHLTKPCAVPSVSRGAIVTPFGWAVTAQQTLWSRTMPANSPFAISFVAHLK